MTAQDEQNVKRLLCYLRNSYPLVIWDAPEVVTDFDVDLTGLLVIHGEPFIFKYPLNARVLLAFGANYVGEQIMERFMKGVIDKLRGPVPEVVPLPC